MTTTEQLYEKIKSLPDEKQQEVQDFVDFLLQKVEKSGKVKESGREYGKFKGKIKMSDDFDEPLEDFKEYME